MNDSKDLKLEEMLDMMEQMQDQIESQDLQLSEERQRNEKLRLENEKLAQMMFLAEEEAEAARKQAKIDVEDIKKEANKRASEFKRSLECRERDVLEREIENDERENSLKLKEDTLTFQVELKAAEKVRDEVERLKADHAALCMKISRDFERYKMEYTSMVYFSVIYGLVITIITAIRKKVVLSDLVALGKGIWKFIKICYRLVARLGLLVAKLGDMIPQKQVSIILHWMLLIVTAVLIAGAFVRILWELICIGWNYFYEYQADEITLFVLLMDIAVVVSLADLIKRYLIVNLIWFMIGILVVCILIRAFFQVE